MTDDQIQALSSWHQEPTTTRAINDALADLWRDAARARLEQTEKSHSDELQQALIRTSVLNSVVYASSQGVAERADSVMAHLSVSHPSRSIVIVAQPDDPTTSLGASLNAQCHADDEGRPRFCFEQLRLTARGAIVQRLPGIVTQLLIHDLPTLLWWPGEPPIGDPFFRAMAEVCDRVIVDSSDFPEPASALANLAEFARLQVNCASLSDLNWDRLTDWREMVAQFFDAAPAQPQISQIRSVIIECADPGGQHDSAQALLLAGWLASRLGWELDRVTRDVLGGGCVIELCRAEQRAAGDGGGHGAAAADGAGLVQIQITASSDRHGQPGALVLVRLVAGERETQAVFTVEASGDGEHGTTTVELPGAQPVSRTVRLEPPAESVLIGEEMEAFGRERAYESALQTAGRFAAQLAGVPG